jgi:hypothetical protein
MARSKRSKGKPRLPRAPLPKQTESVHVDKKKRPFRKEKHRKKWTEE